MTLQLQLLDGIIVYRNRGVIVGEINIFLECWIRTLHDYI